MPIARPLFPAFALLVASGGCASKDVATTAVFTDAQSDDRFQEGKSIVVRYSRLRDVPRYLVVKGRLHLLAQETYAAYFDTIVRMPEWSEAEKADLGRTHPEFRVALSGMKWPRRSNPR